MSEKKKLLSKKLMARDSNIVGDVDLRMNMGCI